MNLHADGTGPHVVCLQRICVFVLEVIKAMTSWVKISLCWIIVCPSEGRGGAPLKKIGEQMIRWERSTHSKVGGIN